MSLDQNFKNIGIIGLGYVGIPLALRFSEVGLPVTGFDINPKLIQNLNSGISPIKHISDEKIALMKQAGFEATADFKRIKEVDAIIICVPTPLTKYNEPDLSYIVSTLDSIVPHLRKGQAISLESTTWPGTTEEVIRPKVEAAGFTVGEDIYLIYSPEREDPGNESFEVRTIPKIVSGSTPSCKIAGEKIYGAVVDEVVPVSSTRAGEMVKLLENIHRSINIGLVNEMKVVTDKLGIDIFEVVDAAASKPFGFTPYYPGPGIGGHCIPIDPFYLTWKAKEVGVHTRFIELAGEINRAMPQYAVNKLIEGLNKQQKSLKGAKILALGIAYKKNVDDMRESPSIDVMEIVRDWGADIQYSDPNIPEFPETREHEFDLKSVELTKENLETFDGVIFLTDHTAFDLEFISKHAKLIIDTRGKFNPDLENVIRA